MCWLMCADKEAANPSVLVPVHNNVLFETKLKSNASQFEGQGSRVCAKKKKKMQAEQLVW